MRPDIWYTFDWISEYEMDKCTIYYIDRYCKDLDVYPERGNRTYHSIIEGAFDGH